MQRGFALLELIFAGALLLSVTLVMVTALVSARSSDRVTGERQKAQYLAQEGIEALRSIRDSSFSSLADGEWGLQREGSAWTLVPGSDRIEDYFERTLAIETPEDGVRSISARVQWEAINGIQEVQVQTLLTDWR